MTTTSVPVTHVCGKSALTTALGFYSAIPYADTSNVSVHGGEDSGGPGSTEHRRWGVPNG